jgi:hypothetical protein
VNYSSIVHVSLSTEENIPGTSHVCIVLSRTEFLEVLQEHWIRLSKRSHVAVWNWVQLFNPNKFYLKRSRVTAFIIDETMLQIGSEQAWLWIAIEPIHSKCTPHDPIEMKMLYTCILAF